MYNLIHNLKFNCIFRIYVDSSSAVKIITAEKTFTAEDEST